MNWFLRGFTIIYISDAKKNLNDWDFQICRGTGAELTMGWIRGKQTLPSLLKYLFWLHFSQLPKEKFQSWLTLPQSPLLYFFLSKDGDNNYMIAEFIFNVRKFIVYLRGFEPGKVSLQSKWSITWPFACLLENSVTIW